MKKPTILFDLDGTLLPMDQDVFTKGYFQLLAGKLQEHGYDPQALAGHIWTGIGAMVQNDGSRTNEEAFWAEFTKIYGEKAREDQEVFERFYREDFQKAQAFCGFNPQAKETVTALKAQGYPVALATNPIFPSIATESRIRWAGLEPEDFLFYTTYENSRFSKPNPEYYRSLTHRLDCPAEACVMVGNDVDEDMVARTVGMEVFLLTDCLINRGEKDLSPYPHGGYSDLMHYLETRK